MQARDKMDKAQLAKKRQVPDWVRKEFSKLHQHLEKGKKDSSRTQSEPWRTMGSKRFNESARICEAM